MAGTIVDASGTTTVPAATSRSITVSPGDGTGLRFPSNSNARITSIECWGDGGGITGASVRLGASGSGGYSKTTSGLSGVDFSGRVLSLTLPSGVLNGGIKSPCSVTDPVNSNILCSAMGGASATSATGGAGGLASEGIGDVKFSGAAGGTSSNACGGGGASSAGTASDGNAGTNNDGVGNTPAAGGAAVTGGGAGGNGAAGTGGGSAPNTAGSDPGGGAGGHGLTASGSGVAGVNGGKSKIVVNYTASFAAVVV